MGKRHKQTIITIMGASFIPTVPPLLHRLTYFLLNRLTDKIYPSSLLVLFFRLELITATNTAITTATTPPITEVLILNNLHFFKKLYHDLCASFILTVPRSLQQHHLPSFRITARLDPVDIQTTA